MLSTCLVRIGDLDRADAYLTKAIDLYRQMEMRPYLIRALFARAELLMHQVRPAEAQETQTEAKALLAAIARESA